METRDDLMQRLTAAYTELRGLAPKIYTPAHVAAQLRAAEKIRSAELLYFVVDAEYVVKRKRNRMSPATGV